ncbi:MAG: hypothetical protein Tsb0021_06720 [Chlamydiales bacterium]
MKIEASKNPIIQTNDNFIDLLPKEVIIKIFSYLDLKSFQSTLFLNKKWKDMTLEAGCHHFKPFLLFIKNSIKNEEDKKQITDLIENYMKEKNLDKIIKKILPFLLFEKICLFNDDTIFSSIICKKFILRSFNEIKLSTESSGEKNVKLWKLCKEANHLIRDINTVLEIARQISDKKTRDIVYSDIKKAYYNDKYSLNLINKFT